MAAAASGEAARARRGPAPIASFDHDVSDESSPETKQSFRLPEIREFPAGGAGSSLAPDEPRGRSHSTPAATALGAPPAPRIDISRASSSSHHDSRDSSPELALFAGTGGGGSEEARSRLELGFREDGALDLRSSTEELAFLEPAPGEPRAPAPPPAAPGAAPPPPPPPTERRHSRKDSQSSEAALLGVSGRTSRLSSVGSQCSAQSAISRVSRLSVVSGVSRSPSPHRMLLETSFCGPKPIETDPEVCAAAVAEHILDLVKMGSEPGPAVAAVAAATAVRSPSASCGPPPAIDARDRREVRTEATVEARSAPATPAPTPPAPAQPPTTVTVTVTETPSLPPENERTAKESTNHVRTEERRARPRVRREPSEPEVFKPRNRSKDIIRIKLKPDDEEDEEEEERGGETARKPASLALGGAARPAGAAPPSPTPSRRRSPSPAGAPVSRKSSFCSLFKSRETVASPDSPSEALRRKRSLTEGRSRSKSRDRAVTPSSAGKIRGSVLSLFRTPRRSIASPSPSSRDVSPGVAPRAPTAAPSIPPDRTRRDLKYYEDTRDGIIHIPLRTPPDEPPAAPSVPRRGSGGDAVPAAAPQAPRPASAPAPRAPPDLSPAAPPRAPAPALVPVVAPKVPSKVPSKPIHRTVLPDGSIIIPLHSPTERAVENGFPELSPPKESSKSVPRPTEAPSPIGSRETSAPAAERDPAMILRSPPAQASTPSPPRAEPPLPEETRRRRKERLVFTTHVGSREQVFSTQFSITKTPSVTSEISGSFPSFAETDSPASGLRDTHIASSPAAPGPAPASATPTPGASGPATPQDQPRDSSESEPSSEAATPRAGNDVERRGLVVQESFEEELPYVPTTLPQERSVALPMVPVRDRGGVRVTSVQRPRGSLSAGSGARAEPLPPPTQPPPPPPPADKLRIKLPRRPRPASAPRPERPRTRSGSDTGSETRVKQEWIDFEEVPERRKQPKRIQTLPATAVSGAAPAPPAGGGVVFSYVEPEHCRCECHGHARAAHDADDQLPLLLDDMQHSRISTSSAEGGDASPAPGRAHAHTHTVTPTHYALDQQSILEHEPHRST